MAIRSADRSFALNTLPRTDGTVVYWMSRDIRACDNQALVYAQSAAIEQGSGFVVVFCLADGFGDAGFRQFSFLVRGLFVTAEILASYGIEFVLLRGDPLP